MPREPDDREEDEPFVDGESEDLSGDAGRLDDESGDEPESRFDDPDGETEEDRRARPKDRVSRRYDTLARETREAREHALRLEQELVSLRQQAQAPRQQTEAEFEAQLQLLEPDQRVVARLQRAQAENTRQNAITRMMANDAADRMSYQTKSVSDRRYTKHAAEVERLLQVERNNGRDFPRETILDFVLGRERRLAGDKIDKARGQAQRRVASQQARTTESRSDQPRGQRTRLGQGNSAADLEYRLKDVFI
jgi:hypothetical protein